MPTTPKTEITMNDGTKIYVLETIKEITDLLKKNENKTVSLVAFINEQWVDKDINLDDVLEFDGLLDI